MEESEEQVEMLITEGQVESEGIMPIGESDKAGIREVQGVYLAVAVEPEAGVVGQPQTTVGLVEMEQQEEAILAVAVAVAVVTIHMEEMGVLMVVVAVVAQVLREEQEETVS